jgi:antitoxin HicB
MLTYKVKLERDDNDTFLVTCPALPEVTTFGTDEAGALHHAAAAIEEALAARISAGDDIPATQNAKVGLTVSLPALTAIKVELYRSARSDRVTPAEMARRLKWHREQVDRLFRLDHASRLDQMEAAFKALGRRLDVDVIAA